MKLKRKTSDSANTVTEKEGAKKSKKKKNQSLLRPGYAKVQKIDLSSKNFRIRVVFFVLLLFIAITAFVYGIYSWLSVDAGWYEIEVNSSAETTAAQEFYLYYNIGAGEQSAYTEYRQLIVKYTELTDEAYMIFSNESYSDYHNLYYLNRHVNEIVTVDEHLYEALCLLEEYDSRCLYFAPAYTQYSNLFGSQYDEEAVLFDPYENEELAAYYAEIAAYANDPSHINIELLGDNQVMLSISDEYLAYAEENGITEYVDFFLLQNAFEIDYIADGLLDEGYTHGTLSSYDGYTRTLGSSGEAAEQDSADISVTETAADTEETADVVSTATDPDDYATDGAVMEWSIDVPAWDDQTVFTAASMTYDGAISLVTLRDYPLYEYDELHYYIYTDGTIRSPYIDLTDGFCKSSVHNLVVFSDTSGCAEIMIRTLPLYATEEFDRDAVELLASDGIDSVIIEDEVISCTSNEVVFTNVHEGYDVVGK